MPSERRLVAVLFADISGFTRLSESMDPEDVQDLIDGLFQRLRGLIETRGGTVDKFIGDAVMAVFGAPLAHEDDPLRAVRAALAMQGAVASYATERHADIRVRIGINAGEVLWGSVGGDRPTATGDVVNVAQRLESAAQPGTVLVSRSVERASAPRVRFRPLGPVRLKGREESVEAFEVVREIEGLTEYRLAGDAPTPFVGREAELSRLLELQRAGKGGFVLLEGEAGSGKSRLLAEFRRRLRDAGVPGPEVHVGRAIESAPLPLAPFSELVRVGSGIAETGPSEEARLIGWLLEPLGALEETPVARENYAHLIALSLGLSPPDARVRFIEPARLGAEIRHAWARWLAGRAAARPVVVCVEDLHWADESTVRLLESLARELHDAPVMIVGTTRPGGPALDPYRRLRLDELGAPEAARLAADVFRRPMAPDLEAFLARNAAGNPLYVEELARHLLDAGLIEGDPARLAGAPEGVPRELAGLLVARLDALPAEEKETVKAASVLGRRFWLGILESLAGPEAGARIRSAAQRGAVAPQPGSLLPGDVEFAFRHALLRDAAYSLLPKRDRTRLHRLAAEALEARPAAAERRIRALAAAQRDAAGDAAAAARLWEEVAVRACEAFSWEEGLSAAKEAQRLGAGPSAVLLEARLLVRLVRPAEALKRAEAVRSDPRATAEDRDRAALAAAHAHQKTGDNHLALEVAETLLRGSPSTPVRVWALARRADSLARTGRLDEALDALRTAFEAEEREGAAMPAPERDDLILMLLGSRAHVYLLRGEYAPALESARAAVARARATANLQWLGGSLANLGMVLLSAGNEPEARESLEQARSTFLQVGDRAGLAGIAQVLGIQAIHRGDSDAAEQHFLQVIGLMRAVGDRWGEAVALTGCGAVRATMLRFREAEEPLLASVALRTELQDRSGESLTKMGLGRVARGLGRLEEADRILADALALARRTGSAHYTNWGLLEIAQLRHDCGRFAEAEALASEAIECWRGRQDTRDMGWALAFRARARLELGDARGLEDAREADRTVQGGVPWTLALAEARFGDRAAGRRALESILDGRAGPLGRLDPRSAIPDAARAAAALGDAAAARRLIHAGLDTARSAGMPVAGRLLDALLATL